MLGLMKEKLLQPFHFPYHYKDVKISYSLSVLTLLFRTFFAESIM